MAVTDRVAHQGKPVADCKLSIRLMAVPTTPSEDEEASAVAALPKSVLPSSVGPTSTVGESFASELKYRVCSGRNLVAAGHVLYSTVLDMLQVTRLKMHVVCSS